MSVTAVRERRPERVLASLARFLPAVRVLAFVAAVAIVVAMAVRAGRDVDVREIAWWPLVPAFAAALGWWLLLARGWALLVGGRWRRSDVGTWCRTQALRYLPGGIWAPASRAVVVRGTLVDKLTTVGAENVIALCAAVAVGGVALASAGDLRWLPLVLLPAAPVVAARFAGKRTRVTPRRSLEATWNYVAAFGAYVVAAVLVQAAVSGLDEPLAVAGAAALAWGAGLVVVIAPSGLAVREVVYAALLAGSFAEAELVAAAVVLRVVTVLAELVVLLAAGRPRLPLPPPQAG